MSQSTELEVRRWRTGCYRITISDRIFAQIRKVGREWYAEYRSNETGNIVRYAGIWSTKREAVEEVSHAIEQGYL